jgi:hypothetical protein
MSATITRPPTKAAAKQGRLSRCLRALFTKKGIATLCVVIVVVFCIYDFLILPRLDVWGATPQEVAMALPGDSIVPGEPYWQMTVAITIKAPPEKIFPYLLQAGQDKAGFYSFDWLERACGFGIHNTYTIQQKWQDTKAGDFCTFTQQGMGMRIHSVTPNRNLLMITNGLDRNHPLPAGKWELLWTPLFNPDKGEYLAWNWDFNLFPQADGSTRVIVRCKHTSKGNRIARFAFKQAFALPSDVMDIEMLQRLKALAEGTYPVN